MSQVAMTLQPRRSRAERSSAGDPATLATLAERSCGSRVAGPTSLAMSVAPMAGRTNRCGPSRRGRSPAGLQLPGLVGNEDGTDARSIEDDAGSGRGLD